MDIRNKSKDNQPTDHNPIEARKQGGPYIKKNVGYLSMMFLVTIHLFRWKPTPCLSGIEF